MITKSAVISECGSFRYCLKRTWAPERPTLGFVMLNPSTADGLEDDPTIRKCIGFAQRLGFGAIVVTNLFAYRATNPKDLKKAGYLVGEDNDTWINHMVSVSNQVVCAWGANARGLDRAIDVMRKLPCPKALRLLSDGTPQHPLMLPYTCTLEDVNHLI